MEFLCARQVESLRLASILIKFCFRKLARRSEGSSSTFNSHSQRFTMNNGEGVTGTPNLQLDTTHTTMTLVIGDWRVRSASFGHLQDISVSLTFKTSLNHFRLGWSGFSTSGFPSPSPLKGRERWWCSRPLLFPRISSVTSASPCRRWKSLTIDNEQPHTCEAHRKNMKKNLLPATTKSSEDCFCHKQEGPDKKKAGLLSE